MRRLELGVLLLCGCEIAAARPAPAPTPAPARVVASSPLVGGAIAAHTLAPSRDPDPVPNPELPPDPELETGPLVQAERVATVVREVYFADRDEPAVALTFDDGPSRENTPRILDILARHGVPATFFVLGRRAELMPDLVARAAAEGHELGNHTWSHGSLRSMLPYQIRRELDETTEAIAAASGVRPGLFRPPFGRYAPSALSIVGERGMNVVLWSVDAVDWDSAPDVVAARVVHDARPGDIVLLHDNRSAVVHALPDIIAGLRAKGLRLVTVSELTGMSPVAEPVGD